jgi:chromosome segregation ATPase
MFDRKPDVRAELKAVLATKSEAQAKLDRLEAARRKSVAAIEDADLRIRRATAALDAARTSAAHDAAAALADGNEAAPIAGLARHRTEIAEAEDAKAVATETAARLADMICEVDREITALPVHRAVCEAMEPKVRNLLDKAYEARSTLDQANAELSMLFSKRVFPANLEMEIATTLGFQLTMAPGQLGSPTRAPDTRALEATLDRLRDDPAGVVDAIG